MRLGRARCDGAGTWGGFGVVAGRAREGREAGTSAAGALQDGPERLETAGLTGRFPAALMWARSLAARLPIRRVKRRRA